MPLRPVPPIQLTSAIQVIDVSKIEPNPCECLFQNESPFAIDIMIGADTHTLGAWMANVYRTPGITHFQVSPHSLAALPLLPSAVLEITTAAEGDVIPGVYPCSLVRQTTPGLTTIPLTAVAETVNGAAAANVLLPVGTQAFGFDLGSVVVPGPANPDAGLTITGHQTGTIYVRVPIQWATAGPPVVPAVRSLWNPFVPYIPASVFPVTPGGGQPIVPTFIGIDARDSSLDVAFSLLGVGTLPAVLPVVTISAVLQASLALIVSNPNLPPLVDVSDRAARLLGDVNGSTPAGRPVILAVNTAVGAAAFVNLIPGVPGQHIYVVGGSLAASVAPARLGLSEDGATTNVFLEYVGATTPLPLAFAGARVTKAAGHGLYVYSDNAVTVNGWIAYAQG